jgi:hypothetical protein
MRGEHYGYPSCCIEAFIDNPIEKTEAQLSVNNSTGFIPCPEHAEMIWRKEITLESLITNRKCLTPFPKDEMDI